MRWVREIANDIKIDTSTFPKEGVREPDSSVRFQAQANPEAQKAEVRNSFENWAWIREQYRTGRAKDVPEGGSKGPALILGSGPSLDDVMPYIKDFPGAVFCGTTQAPTCVYHQREPDYVCLFDTATTYEELEGVDWYKAKLVTHPGIAHDLLVQWPAEFLMFRNMDPNIAWYTDHLANAYSFIERTFLTFAMTVATEMTAAHCMGYSPLILAGVDLGYPEGRPRFTRWRVGEKDVATEKFFDPGMALVAENGVLTDRACLFYKRALMCAWRLDKSQLLSVSRGILHEVPSISIKDAMAGQFPPLMPAETIVDITERYLAANHTYCLPLGGGIRLIECRDWRVDLPNYLGKIVSMGFKGIDVDGIMRHVASLHGEAA